MTLEQIDRERVALKLWGDEPEYRARLVENFVNSVVYRLLPAIAELTASERHLIDSTYQHFMDAAPHDNIMVGYEAAGSCQDLEIDLCWDLCEVNQQVMGIAFAGLFHNFERTIKHIIVRENRHQWGALIGQRDVSKLGFAELIDLLASVGYIVAGPIARDLRLLNLISNVVKHGDGASLQKITANFKDVFPTLECNGSTSADILEMELTSELLLQLARSVSAFWWAFPRAA